MNEKETAKQRLVNVARELICKGKKPSEITVAEITEAAGVGNGMVNYHFQSKDNLMKTAVREVVVEAKEKLHKKLKLYENCTAKERLTFILKEVADFLAENPEIGRITILDNLAENDGLPHILSDIKEFNQSLNELLQGDERIILIKNFLIAGVFNFVFLKTDIIKQKTGFDFYDEAQRAEGVTGFVNEILSGTDIEKCKGGMCK